MSHHFFAKNVSATGAMVACVLCLLGRAAPIAAQVQTAIEYGFYSYWDDCYYLGISSQLVCDYSSYFVTSFPDEIAELDTGAYDSVGGQFVWQRTGETFNVWSGPESGALATCRFYNAFNATSFPEHFYTPYPAACAAVRANAQSNYQYEGIAFYLQVPDANGNCPIGTIILYRLYSGQERRARSPLDHERGDFQQNACC